MEARLMKRIAELEAPKRDWWKNIAEMEAGLLKNIAEMEADLTKNMAEW